MVQACRASFDDMKEIVEVANRIFAGEDKNYFTNIFYGFRPSVIKNNKERKE